MARAKLSATRLLNDVYSPGEQRRLAIAGSLRDVLTAQLRFDQLLSRTIVLPDTHFLDGPFFSLTDPAELVRDIGRGFRDRKLGLEIQARPTSSGVPAPGSRLAGALATLLFRGDGRLNAFPFNSLSDAADRVALAQAIEVTSASALAGRLTAASGEDVARALGEFLRDRSPSALAKTEIEQLERGWRAWIRAEREGTLKVVPWRREIAFRDGLLADPLRPDTELRTVEGRRLLANIVNKLEEGTRHRSDINKLLERERANFGWRQGTDPDEEQGPDDGLRDLWTIDAWYSRVRHWAMAQQHDASLALTIHPFEPARSGAWRLLRSVGSGATSPTVQLPDELLPGLALIEGDQYGRFSHDQRPALQTLWAHGRAADAKAVLSALLPLLEKESPLRHRISDKLGALAIVFGMTRAVTAVEGSGLASAASAALTAGAEGSSRLAAKSRRPIVHKLVEHLERRSQGPAGRPSK
jgi:hypothetical protein